MSLVYACITPHTPILVPTIGKDGLGRLEATQKAMLQLEQDLCAANPDILLVVSPHGEALPDAVSINLSPKYVTNFSEFGDVTTKLEWKPEIELMTSLREDFKLKRLPLVLGSPEYLDYGSAVPLSYLAVNLPHVKVIPMTVATGLDAKTHYEFGKQLKDELMCSVKRVAVIASADLSHRVAENSPGGLSPKGVAFDEKVMETLKTNNLVGILDIDAAWTAEAQSCGTNVLALLAGILDDVRHEPKILSYERPLGVGYLVATIKVE